MQIIKTSVIENIKHNFEELFPAEKKTAQYILDHLEEVTLLNISQLAKKAHASEASIVRMAKHLGYNGFFQMRLNTLRLAISVTSFFKFVNYCPLLPFLD